MGANQHFKKRELSKSLYVNRAPSNEELDYRLDYVSRVRSFAMIFNYLILAYLRLNYLRLIYAQF